MTPPILDAIHRRRSIREFTDQPVEKNKLHEIIKAGTWAPSGLNNQPWRFATIADTAVKNDIAGLTRYSHIIKAAFALIAVFIDKKAMYHEVKDHQAMGACIQNMLLAAEALDLGAVWLGEILKNAQQVNAVLEIGDQYDLMAVIALGYPTHHNQKSQRKDIKETIIKEI